MRESFRLPVGLHLAQTARILERAFDDALAEAGGTLPVWLILLNLKIREPGNQRELAAAVGVREATLTHHLNAMDARGLITRTRDAANRRVQVVGLTAAGEASFLRLRDVAATFDARLRAGLSTTDLAQFASVLDRLAVNAAVNAAGNAAGGDAADDAADPGDSIAGGIGAPPWAGLAEPAEGGPAAEGPRKRP